MTVALRGPVLLCTAMLALAGLLPARAEAQTEEPPNILVFVTDDQRAANTLWVMPETRHYFRRKGTEFPNAFAVTPLCCPSRATIFTGRYAHNTGVRSQDSAPLDATTMFPRLLQEAGYRTGIAGKFLNRWPAANPPPYFDRFATMCLCGPNPYTNPTMNIDGSMRTLTGYSTNLIGTYASRFLRQFEADDDRPWFLYVAPTAPHWPWLTAPRYARAPLPKWNGNPAVLERDRSDKPPFVRDMRYTLKQGRRVRLGQLRLLMSVDDMVGRIFRTLNELGENRRTLAIFTSDNGFTWADHGLGGDGRTGGQKRLPYTPSARVPFLMRWPAHVAPGVVDPRLTGNVDIAPTVLEAAGVAPDPTKPPLDGRSLLGPGTRDRILLEYWRENRIPTWASIRTATFQYTEYYDEDDVTTTFREYYDLTADPWQLRNLLRDGDPNNNPDVAPLAAQLALDRVCAGTGPNDACP